MENLPIKGRLEQFDLKHSAKGPAVRVGEAGGWWAYPDGAMREHSQLGQLLEPESLTQKERLHNIIQYHEALLELNVEAFDELKQQLMQTPHVGEDPRIDEQEVELRKLRREILASRRAVATAEADIERLKPRATKAKNAIEQEGEELCEAFRNKISKIKV